MIQTEITDACVSIQNNEMSLEMEQIRLFNVKLCELFKKLEDVEINIVDYIVN